MVASYLSLCVLLKVCWSSSHNPFPSAIARVDQIWEQVLSATGSPTHYATGLQMPQTGPRPSCCDRLNNLHEWMQQAKMMLQAQRRLNRPWLTRALPAISRCGYISGIGVGSEDTLTYVCRGCCWYLKQPGVVVIQSGSRKSTCTFGCSFPEPHNLCCGVPEPDR